MLERPQKKRLTKSTHKQEVLQILSKRLGCNIEDVTFLFAKPSAQLAAQETEIPDQRFAP